MTSLGLRVPRERGEEVRRELLERDLLRTDVRIVREGATLLLPLAAALPGLGALGEITSAEFPPLDDAAEPARYQDLVHLPPERAALLPRAFDVVGDIVLLRLPPELAGDASTIGAALLRFVPGARLVGADRGVHGPDRLRSLTRIAGDGPWRTVHRENGIAFDVDVERAYFSPRLAREHARVAERVAPRETVYDLCCGVGPFAVSIARDGRAGKVAAVDRNPAAIELLRATLARGGWGDRVDARNEPLEDFLSRAPPCDRAILNLPREGIKYLSSVARSVRPGGTIHYYEVVDRSEREGRERGIVDELGGDSGWSLAERRTVHAYSPDSDLMAFTLAREGSR